MNGYAGATCEVGPVGILKGFAKPICPARANATRSTSQSSLDRSRLNINALTSRNSKRNRNTQRQVWEVQPEARSPVGALLMVDLTVSIVIPPSGERR